MGVRSFCAIAAVIIAAMPGNLAADEKETATTVENFKKIILGLHAYHGTYKSFPPTASRDKDGTKLLSWRVLILPELGERDLYNQFRLDEPWDSDHNKALVAKMPDVFKNPRVAKVAAGLTTLQLPVAAGTIAEHGEEFRVSDVKDGTVHTIFVVEVAAENAVEWTRPADLEWDEKKPADKLFFDATAESIALFASGDVMRLPKTMGDDNFRLYFLRADGGIAEGAIDIGK